MSSDFPTTVRETLADILDQYRYWETSETIRQYQAKQVGRIEGIITLALVEELERIYFDETLGYSMYDLGNDKACFISDRIAELRATLKEKD